MAQPVSLDFKTSVPTLVQEKPCYTELVECIQAIWNRVYAWICEWINWLIPPPEYDLAKRSPDAFCHMMRYLELEEVARCERVAKSWKIDKIWQAQCANNGVTAAPPSGRFKDLFSEIPEMAFGPREWREHFGKAGPIPPLSEKVRSQIAERKSTHTLTLIPKTVNGEPLSLNTFAPLAQKAGMKLDISGPVSEKYGNEAAGKSLWVWLQKEVEPNSRMPQVAVEKVYPLRFGKTPKLGKTLWIVVSIVAHYARNKICLFPQEPTWIYIHTRDWGGEDQDKPNKYFYGSKAWSVVVGGSSPGQLFVVNFHPLNYGRTYVASAAAAEEFN